jgi:S-adenosylmethionine hydrolase
LSTPETVSFLSDYGTDDEFVGVVRSVIRSIAPQAAVVDLTHGIPAHDVRAGALALARTVQYVATPGVILAVVDPGVGTARRAVAVSVADGEGIFVAPDNGLIAAAVAMAGGAERAVALTNPEYHLPRAGGATFDGRDVFAPVAAHLCNGVPFDDLGDPVDVATLLPGVLPVAQRTDDVLDCEVLWVDRYGNAQLNVDPDDVEFLGERIQVRAGDEIRTARRAEAYGAIPQGQVGIVIDSYGLVSVCVDRGSAAAELHLAAGDAVALAPGVGVATEVTLGRRAP